MSSFIVYGHYCWVDFFLQHDVIIIIVELFTIHHIIYIMQTKENNIIKLFHCTNLGVFGAL